MESFVKWKMSIMLKFNKVLFVLFFASIFAVNVHARMPSAAIQDKAAELGFRVGPETKVIPGGGIRERIWVDKRNIIVPGTDSKSYLIRFWQSCQGTLSKKIVPRATKKVGQISQYDKYATLYEGRNIAICQIKYIYELEPI